jgi:hypothetical protein
MYLLCLCNMISKEKGNVGEAVILAEFVKRGV